MPKVPTYESHVELDPPGLGPLMPYDDPVGQAIARTGNAVTKVGLQAAEYFVERRERMKQEQDQARLLDAQTRFEEEERQHHEKAGTLMGREASEAADRGAGFYRDRYTKYSEEFRDRQDLQRQWDAYYQNRVLNGLGYLSRISARGQWEERKGLFDMARDGKIKDAVTWASDPDRVNAAMDEYAELLRRDNPNRDVEPMVKAARATILTLTTEALLAQRNVPGAEMLLAQHERDIPEEAVTAIRENIKSESQKNAINNTASQLRGADEAMVEQALNKPRSPLIPESKTMVKEIVATEQAVEKRRQADAKAADFEERYRQLLELNKDGKLDAAAIMGLGFDEPEQRRLLFNLQQAETLAKREALEELTAQDYVRARAAIAWLFEKSIKTGLKNYDLVEALPFLSKAEFRGLYEEVVKGKDEPVSGWIRLTDGVDQLLDRAKAVYHNDPDEYHKYVIEFKKVLKETNTPVSSRKAIKLGQDLLVERVPGIKRFAGMSVLDRSSMIAPGLSSELFGWEVREFLEIPRENINRIEDFLKANGRPASAANILYLNRQVSEKGSRQSTAIISLLEAVDLSGLPDKEFPSNENRDLSLLKRYVVGVEKGAINLFEGAGVIGEVTGSALMELSKIFGPEEMARRYLEVLGPQNTVKLLQKLGNWVAPEGGRSQPDWIRYGRRLGPNPLPNEVAVLNTLIAREFELKKEKTRKVPSQEERKPDWLRYLETLGPNPTENEMAFLSALIAREPSNEPGTSEQKGSLKVEKKLSQRTEFILKMLGPPTFRTGAILKYSGKLNQSIVDRWISGRAEWLADPDEFYGKSWKQLLEDPKTRWPFLAGQLGEITVPIILSVAADKAGGPVASFFVDWSTGTGSTYNNLRKRLGNREDAKVVAVCVGFFQGLLGTVSTNKIVSKINIYQKFLGETTEVFIGNLTARQVFFKAVLDLFDVSATTISVTAIQKIIEDVGIQFYENNKDQLGSIDKKAFTESLTQPVSGQRKDESDRTTDLNINQQRPAKNELRAQPVAPPVRVMQPY